MIYLIILAIAILIVLKASSNQRFNDWQEEHPFDGRHTFADVRPGCLDHIGALTVAVLALYVVYLALVH